MDSAGDQIVPSSYYSVMQVRRFYNKYVRFSFIKCAEWFDLWWMDKQERCNEKFKIERSVKRRRFHSLAQKLQKKIAISRCTLEIASCSLIWRWNQIMGLELLMKRPVGWLKSKSWWWKIGQERKNMCTKIIRILHKSNKALVQQCLANIRFLQTISDVIDRLRLARKLLNILRRHTQVEAAGAGQSNYYLSK